MPSCSKETHQRNSLWGHTKRTENTNGKKACKPDSRISLEAWHNAIWVFGSYISCTLGLICTLGLWVLSFIVFVVGNTSNIWRSSFPESCSFAYTEAVYSSTEVCQCLLILYGCCMFLAKVFGCACMHLFSLKTLCHKVSKVTQMFLFSENSLSPSQ